MKSQYDISIIVPVYNERDNLEHFRAELKNALSEIDKSFEIIFIDDGSVDGSREIIEGFAAQDPEIKAIFFTRNFGQTSAISAGIKYSTGEIIIPIDADLQNDPRDIPLLLAKIDEGYDVVSGWRKDRKDPFSKKIPSKIANKLISFIGGVHLHDYGCSLKAYRRDIIKHVRLYGEMHRFIPLYAHWVGAKTTEIPVNHRPRTAGKSKYGIARIFKVTLDLLVAKFFGSYFSKPIYFFGFVGSLLDFISILFVISTIIDKYEGIYVHRNPKMLIAVFLFILGFLFIMLGLIAELLMRIYYESQDKEPYFIKKSLNCPSSDDES